MHLQETLGRRFLGTPRLAGELQRQIGEKEGRLLVVNGAGVFRPNDGRVMTGQTGFDHLLNAAKNSLLVAGDNVGLLLDQQRDVRVLLEAVAGAVEMEIEALLPEFLQACLGGGAVQVGADANREKFCLGDAGGQDFALFGSVAAQTAKGVHEDGRRQSHGRPAGGVHGILLRPPIVNPSRPSVGAGEVMLQHGLEVGLAADLLEEGQADFGVMDGDFTGAQHGPAFPFTVAGSQAGGQKPQSAAGALEVGNGRPPLPHQVDQRWMKRIRIADAIAQGDAVFLGLLPFRIALGVGPPHLRDHLLVAGRRPGQRPGDRVSWQASGVGRPP